MGTVLCIVGVVIGSAALERRFVAQGDAAAARSTKQFSRWFLIGAGACVAWMWLTAALALLA